MQEADLSMKGRKVKTHEADRRLQKGASLKLIIPKELATTDYATEGELRKDFCRSSKTTPPPDMRNVGFNVKSSRLQPSWESCGRQEFPFHSEAAFNT